MCHIPSNKQWKVRERKMLNVLISNHYTHKGKGGNASPPGQIRRYDVMSVIYHIQMVSLCHLALSPMASP